MINYSLLTSDRAILADKGEIHDLLCQGIKVIAFGVPADLEKLGTSFENYKKARLLQLYPVRNPIPALTVMDGALDDKTREILQSISELAPSIRAASFSAMETESSRSNISESEP